MTTATRPKRGPVIFRPDDPAVVPAPPAPQEETGTGAEITPIVAAPPRRRGLLGLLAASVAALVVLGLGYDTATLVTALFDDSVVLGTIGAVLAAVVAVTLLVLTVREVRGFLLLRHIDDIRRLAERVHADSADRTAAARAMAELDRLYAHRPDLDWVRARFNERRADAADARDALTLFEQEVLRPLDARAQQAIGRTAQATAVFTAISPFVALDILITSWRNLGLLREIAACYGGRPGLAGSLSLMRRVLVNLALAGGLQVGDSFAHDMLGGGMAARVSTRLGEGVVNGLLSVRVGVAAMKLCRPLPFDRAPEPNVRDMAGHIVNELRKRL